ncbi:hypothetical protein LOD99_14529 [Oopsacas minuta]|uniref:MULE transposase domain-containing protein n=1 Tax=Oopsacas minuta TaxID=111878 RepID=A0AAV7KH20_9METZ|nr:hypothetical protein LOD99_14529 [Oopsacas minuta]
MEIVKRMNGHLYVPDVQATACCEIKAGIKRKARDTQDSSHHIIGEGMLTASEGTAAKLPKLNSVQRTAKGEQFLLYDSGEDDAHRFLIFGMLQQSKIWLADGTFKTAPPFFAQVYVVHGLRGGDDPMKTGHLLPSLFVLLPNKTENTYRRVWEQIHLLCPLVQPEQILLHFEKGAINSFEHVWPNTVVKCCFLHPTQNTWRHVQSAYTHDEELAMRIRKIPALAFARPADVPKLFEQVAWTSPLRLR